MGILDSLFGSGDGTGWLGSQWPSPDGQGDPLAPGASADRPAVQETAAFPLATAAPPASPFAPGAPAWLTQMALAPNLSPAPPAAAAANPNASNAPSGIAANPFSGGGGAPGQAASPDIGDRLNAALMNIASARGLIPTIAGTVAGLASGARTDPVGMMQQAQQAAAMRALGAGGVPAAANAAAPGGVAAAPLPAPAPAPVPAPWPTRAALEAEARRRRLIQ